eukprot:COSAG05_NODE_8704_length_679_cov_0.881034_1_plen_69_part_00
MIVANGAHLTVYRARQDNGHFCNDTHERAVIEAEGSAMGPLIRAVNYIAAHLASEFPSVAVDTLCAGN